MKSKIPALFSKILFIFSLVLVFSFSQVNFSFAQVRDLTCYVLAGKVVDINGVKVLDDNLPRCNENPAAYTSSVSAGGAGATTAAASAALTTINNNTSAQLAAAQAANAEAAKSALNPCTGVGSVLLLGIDGVPCQIWLLFTKFVLQLSAELANLSGYLFDYSTQKFVLQISTMFKDQDTKDSTGNITLGKDKAYIYGAWSVIRDLANIMAFFGAVYTGFRYITGSDSLDFKKAVTKLILYSILVNFSFPIAKFFIDISNVISLQIYGGISEYKIGDNELSRRLLSAMNLNSLVSQIGSANKDLAFKGFSSFSLMWLAIIYLLSTFGVFLYAALMILVRSFILLACVILSPLMFLNFAFPKLTELHEKWRENFFGQLVFAPVLMFGFWLSFILLQAALVVTDPSAGPVGATASYGGVAPLINMLLAILSLFLTVKMAGSVAGGAGKGISSMVGGGMKNLGLAAATGGAGMFARGTIGRAGSAMANSKWVKNTGNENGATRRMAASLASNAGNRMSSYKLAGTKSFDDKVSGDIKGAKDKARENHGQALKETGLADQMAQATSVKEVEKVLEEMRNIQSNPNHKRNNDLFGRNAEKKAKEADQNVRKEMRLGNVSGGNRAEYIELTNKLNEKSKFDNGTDNTDLRNKRLARAIELRGDKLDSLKNTTLTSGIAKGVGSTAGATYDAVTDNAVTRDIGKVTDALVVNPLKKAGDILDRPGIIESVSRNVSEGFRSKKISSSSNSSAASTNSTTPAEQTVTANTQSAGPNLTKIQKEVADK